MWGKRESRRKYDLLLLKNCAVSPLISIQAHYRGPMRYSQPFRPCTRTFAIALHYFTVGTHWTTRVTLRPPLHVNSWLNRSLIDLFAVHCGRRQRKERDKMVTSNRRWWFRQLKATRKMVFLLIYVILSAVFWRCLSVQCTACHSCIGQNIKSLAVSDRLSGLRSSVFVLRSQCEKL